ncbi:hypothetical protein KR054_003288, partial [Drosophila jambulina]
NLLLLFSKILSISNFFVIQKMDDLEAAERYDDVVDKYKELKIVIPGTAVGLHGKVVTHGLMLERHLVFHYVDHTIHDVIQTCTFVVSQAPGECEGIQCYCSGFLSRPPRPLLELAPLTVCKDGVRVAEKVPVTETELTTEAESEAVPEGDPNAETQTEANPKATDNERAKFRMFN